MRSVFFVSCSVVLGVVVLGCGAENGSTDTGSSGGDAGSDGGGTLAPSSFDLVVPAIDVPSGVEEFRCFHTTIDVGRAAGVKRWTSSFSPGVAEFVVYFLSAASKPDGTMEACDFPTAFPTWVYGTQRTPYSLEMPDGVARRLEQPQPVMVRIHYVNTSAGPLTASATITGELRPAGESFAPAASFVSYNSRINIPPQATGSVSGSCDVPFGVSFFALTTQTHRASTRTEVRDGTTIVFQSSDWTNPGDAQWGIPPHYAFGGALGYTCEYDNRTNGTLTSGDTYNDESCTVVAHFFPATGSVLCIDSVVIP